MNDDTSKLRLHQHPSHDSELARHSEQQSAALEFATVEEMIRADKERVEVPAAIGERLNQSIAGEPTPERPPWWKRLLGGQNS